MALKAPRNLKEPVRCRHSGLTRSRPPSRALTTGDSMRGVRTARSSSRVAAARISARPGSVERGSEAADEGIDSGGGIRFVEVGRMADIGHGNTLEVGLGKRHPLEGLRREHV